MDAADGAPVWLCSVSHYDPRRGRIIGTGEWSGGDFALATRLALSALRGVGDPARERAFRMNITFCVHRLVSDAEREELPASWGEASGGLAGGPVEVLWSRGIPHRPAAMPCADPLHEVLDARRPDLWLPLDCGRCEPCRARAVIAERIGFVEGLR